MKPRTLQTLKILAVAVAAAGCTRTVGAEVGAEPTQPPVPVQPSVPAPPAAAEVAAAPLPQPAPPPEPQVPAPPATPDRALISLARELDGTGLAAALKQEAHFRPLCDSDGYALVGNAGGKGLPSLAAKFCAATRRNAQR